MLTSIIVRTVRACTGHPWPVIAAFAIATILSGFYAATHFAINTDIKNLITSDLDWRARDLAFEAAFPSRVESILVVVDAPTPELTAQATAALAQRLSSETKHFRAVQRLGGGPFFEHNALLFLPLAELEQTAPNLGRARQLIEILARDQSLRGVADGLSAVLLGVRGKRITLDQLARPLTMADATLTKVLAGEPASFSWRAMTMPEPPTSGQLRQFIDVRPVLDFSALEPGRMATDAVRAAAKDLDLTGKYRARVRLTGPVPIADEEFATVQEGALVNGLATLVIVLTILFLALRSGRIILAVFLNLFVGLSITAALGLMMVGALNLISIAFAVLFVGLGVDFGIQYAVRYRAERNEDNNLQRALIRAAGGIGAPLTLAAGAVALGFLSFLPTDYRGVSELGQIAGVGMLVAYVTSITLLPAIMKVLNPRGEPEPVGYRALAPVDNFLQKYRYAVIGGTLLVILGASPLLYFLTFDFNPINLRSNKVESVATFLDLRSDPNVGANSVDMLLPNLKDAEAAAKRLSELPQVARTMTLQSFVPQDQTQKLAIIAKLKAELGPALGSNADAEPPSDEETVEALKDAADGLSRAAGEAKGPGADAARKLAASLTKLADAQPAVRQRAATAFVPPLRTDLNEMRSFLQAEPVTIETLPANLKREWVLPDGRARVEAQPSGDPNDNGNLRRFAKAVLNVYPMAMGGPISILRSTDTILTAFVQAGAFALISITLLLWIVLRRFVDVLLTITPLMLSGLLTLELCVLIGMPLNFANIIALPLLFGVGVAFKIYYIMAWRSGQTALLQSSLTRAVIWSALTTATAFGSLWLSSHPGTSSMGKLLALSLVCTLGAAVLFQPALMGSPRSLR